MNLTQKAALNLKKGDRVRFKNNYPANDLRGKEFSLIRDAEVETMNENTSNIRYVFFHIKERGRTRTSVFNYLHFQEINPNQQT